MPHVRNDRMLARASLLTALIGLGAAPAYASTDTYDIVIYNTGTPQTAQFAAQFLFDSDDPTPPGPRPEGDYLTGGAVTFNNLITGSRLPPQFVETTTCTFYVSMADVNIPNDGKDTADPTDFPNAIVGTWVEGAKSLDNTASPCVFVDNISSPTWQLELSFTDSPTQDWANFVKAAKLTRLVDGQVTNWVYGICNRSTPQSGPPPCYNNITPTAPVPATWVLLTGGLVVLRLFRTKRQVNH